MFESLVGRSQEFLRVLITPTDRELIFGNKDAINKRYGQPRSLSIPLSTRVTLHLDHPVRFAFRLLLDRKLGLGESFMAADWRADPTPTKLLRLLIKARSKSFPSSRGFRVHACFPSKPKVTAFLCSRPSQFCKKSKQAISLPQAFLGAIRKLVFFINFVQHRIRGERCRKKKERNKLRKHIDRQCSKHS